MGTRTFGLITALATAPAIGAVASPGPSTAMPEAKSYADLLEPIPNAVERLKAADAEEMARPARLIQAQYHDHHHHNHHDHHHHHHHNSWGSYYADPYYSGSYYYGTPYYYNSPYYQYPYYNQGYYYPRGRYYNRHHHHHHHHHHHNSWPR
jgi:hypothetical protein